MRTLITPLVRLLGKFPPRFLCWTTLAIACLVLVVQSPAKAADPWSLSDPRLRTVTIDHSDTESFLGICADTQGRIFVGGREALFVLEPNDEGGFHPKKELYRFPADSWVYDIQIRGNDLYVLTVSALYVLPNARIEREAITPKRLIWGVPMGHVHQCLHGMTWGPDGYLYFSMGDPVWYYGDFNRPDHWGYWTFFSQPDGTKTPYNGVGGVFRCRPDGSDFQVIARGLRNSCGLVFDSNWNLFTNDNDHEGMPEGYVPGRLIHVTPHNYFSWPRGWMLFKTPERADLLQTMNDKMGRAVPVGQTLYDEQLFPAEYRNSLLVARWGQRTVSQYPLQHRGASFKAEEAVLLSGADIARPVHVAVGRGGRLFVSIAHMPQNEGSPVYPSDLVMVEPVTATEKFGAYDCVTVDAAKLWSELSSPSWHQRLRAHVEIERRGGQLLAEASQRLASVSPTDPARMHLPWLAARTGETDRLEQVKQWATHADASLRLQAIRILAEAHPEQFTTVFEKALDDADPQVQLAALAPFFDSQLPLPFEKIAALARVSDTYIRQTAALLLAERATPDQLQSLSESEDREGRLAAVLALGFRLTMPPIEKVIGKDLPLSELRSESTFVINYADAKVDLRDHGRLGVYTVAEHWNAIAQPESVRQVFDMLATRLDDSDQAVATQAAFFLSLLNDKTVEPRIAKVVTENEDRKLMAAPITSVETVWLAGPFLDQGKGLQTVHPPEEGVIDLGARYSPQAPASTENPLEWKTVQRMDFGTRFYNLGASYGPNNDSSFYAYFRLESPRQQPALLLFGSDDGLSVWQNGKKVWTNAVRRGALPFQDAIRIRLEPGSNDILVRVQNFEGEYGMYLHYRAATDVKYSLPEKLDFAGLADRLSSAGKTATVGPEFLTVDWQKVVPQGDKKRGKLLFGADGLGCIKCHGIDQTQGGNNGPSLADAAKRFTIPYLVESVLVPSKMISPVFKATLIATVDGEQLTGLVVGETGEKIELLLRDTKRRTIATSEIDQRRILEESPMPHGLVKTPEELRDLLAYLLGSEP